MNSPGPHRVRKTTDHTPWWTRLRWALALSVFAWLAFRIHEKTLSVTDIFLSAFTRPLWLSIALAFVFMGLFMAVLRWHTILRSRGLGLPLIRTFRIFFMGQFFNAFLLGACGGDVARAYAASREHPEKRAETAFTAVVDRIIGLLTMMVFTCVMILLRAPMFFGSPSNRKPAILLLLFLGVALVIAMLLFKRHLFERYAFFQKIETSTRIGPYVRKLYDGFYFYRGRKAAFFTTVAASLAQLTFLTLACVCFAHTVGIERPLIDHFTLFPMINVLASVPATPGGLGVREALFVALYGAIHVPMAQALPLSLWVYIGGVCWSLFGGLLFLTDRRPAGRSLQDEFRTMTHTPPQDEWS